MCRRKDSLERASAFVRGPRGYVDMSLLQTMISGMPLVLGR